MSPRTIRRLVLFAAAPLVPLLLLAARPSGHMTRVAGTYTMTYSQRHPIPVPDADGHVVIATEATGANRSTGPSPFEDGAQVTIIESADMTQGTGPHQGYAVISLNGNVRVNTLERKAHDGPRPGPSAGHQLQGNLDLGEGPRGPRHL